MKRLSISLLVAIVFFCAADTMPRFFVITKAAPQLSFTRAGQSYTLGISADEFHRRFGTAQKSAKDEDTEGYLAQTTTDYYTNEGMLATANKTGKMIGYIFYTAPSSVFPAKADVATDRGIRAASTEADVLKQYGAPAKRDEHKSSGVTETALYYRFGENVLSFRFRSGVLQAIGMNADYLPYLK